ncbi:MAG: phytoene/squalene synthase family protein [Pirellulales bacterium]
MNDQLAASYAHCQRIARRSGSSFYYSFLLLPKNKRLAMCALYAFLRRTDDLVDSDEPLAEQQAALAKWRVSLADALAGRYDDPLLPALADVVQSHELPLEYLTAAIDGAAMDLAGTHYQTFAQLEQYCERVASMVGLACLRIWGCRAPEAEGPARRCGIAFQLTNILRDLGEDAARGRIYLPREDLERFGYRPEDLRSNVRDERFRRLMQFEIERNERLYEEGTALAQWLAPRERRVFASMTAVYRALLAEIKRRDGDVLSARVRLSNWRKMRIATRCFLLGPRLVPAGGVVAP